MNVRVERFLVLVTEIEKSALVISHCGAGILLESLRANKTKEVKTKCVAVVNESLMDNHQSEIADALADQSYIVKATVSSVLDCVDAVLRD